MKNIPPAPPPVRYVSAAHNITTVAVPRRKMRFFWSDNATRPVLCRGSALHFTRVKHTPGGGWTGYICTTDKDEINALLTACVTVKSLREITGQEFSDLTKIQHESWKIEDYLPEAFAVENLVPTNLPEKCWRSNRIIHCVERHKQKNPDALRRVRFAFDSWVRLYMTGEVVPCHVWKYKRSSLDLGDNRDLPYLKDVLAEGLNQSTHPDDVIMLTNDDTVLHPDLATVVFKYLEQVPAVCSGRLNYKFGQLPDWTAKIKKDNWGGDIGRDLFAFRKKWLVSNLKNIPDFFLGELEWDLVMNSMIRLKVGRERMTLRSREERNPKCELPVGYVWHEDHEKAWRNMDLFYNPAKRHNIEEMKTWYQANKMEKLITIT